MAGVVWCHRSGWLSVSIQIFRNFCQVKIFKVLRILCIASIEVVIILQTASRDFRIWWDI